MNIENLYNNGKFYSAIEETEDNIRSDLGNLWKIHKIKSLLKFKDYTLKNKLSIILTKKDSERLFIQSLYHHKYKLVMEDFHLKNKDLHEKVFGKTLDLETIRAFYKVCSEIFYKDIYLIKDTLKKDDIVADVGGNMGLFTLCVKNRYPNATVYYYEPSESTYLIAKHLLRYYGVLCSRMEAVAIGDKDGHVDFCKSKNPLISHIDNKYSSESLFDFNEKVLVPIKKLDSIFYDNKIKVTLIKIDTEGYEMEVLMGAINTIKKYHPRFLIAIDHSVKQKKEIVEFFKANFNTYNFKQLNDENLYVY